MRNFNTFFCFPNFRKISKKAVMENDKTSKLKMISSWSSRFIKLTNFTQDSSNYLISLEGICLKNTIYAKYQYKLFVFNYLERIGTYFHDVVYLPDVSSWCKYMQIFQKVWSYWKDLDGTNSANIELSFGIFSITLRCNFLNFL